MDIILKRVGIFLLVVVAAGALFVALSLVGKSTLGPLSSLFDYLNRNLVRIEHTLIGQQKQQRKETLRWFTERRDALDWLRQPDRFLFGAYDDFTQETYEPIMALEDSLHTRLPIIHCYTAWGSKREQVFPFLRAQAIYDLGSVPMITWEPWLNDFNPEKFPWVRHRENPNVGGMSAIANGAFDAYIDEWAAAAKAFGHPILLRFAHEMNDPYRYPWGPQNNSGPEFVAAWEHIHQRFRQQGANNVLWVWSPHPSYDYFEAFWPGEAYVDWIGVTTLNYGNVATWSRWWSFQDIFGKAYEPLRAFDKPIMLTEISSLATGGDRAMWFEDAFERLKTDYPGVRAAVFFHVNSDLTTSYKALDWSFRTDDAVLKVLRKHMQP
jgi:hypothetical protein